MSDLHPDTVEDRVRLALRTVAGTVSADTLPYAVPAPPAASPAASRRRRSRWWGLAPVVALVVPLGLVAGMQVRSGPEYVTAIDPDRVVQRGTVDGSEWVLFETDRVDDCGPVTGVELGEESHNLLGNEWSTTGYSYGEPVVRDCGPTYDPAPWLADPTRYDGSGMDVGDSLVWVFAVHPEVDAVRVGTGPDAQDLPVHLVDGAGYAAWEVPAGAADLTSALVVDGQVLPGSTRSRPLAGG